MLGLAPEGVLRSSSPPVAPENDTVFVTVHWDVGTDIELELDFGDGTALYSWNWQVRVYSWNWLVRGVLVKLTGARLPLELRVRVYS